MSYLWQFRWGGLVLTLLLLGCAASSAFPYAQTKATDTSNHDMAATSNLALPTVTEITQTQSCVPTTNTASTQHLKHRG